MTKSLRLLPALLLAAATAACIAGDESAADRSAADTTQLSMPDTATLLNFQGDFEGPLGLQLWSVREQLEADLSATLAWVRELFFRAGSDDPSLLALIEAAGRRSPVYASHRHTEVA